jgi:hypothetical protein
VTFNFSRSAGLHRVLGIFKYVCVSVCCHVEDVQKRCTGSISSLIGL